MVRQRFDFSCGLAALATLLTHTYGNPVSEQALLRELDRIEATGDPRSGGVSFTDLARLARRHGYRVRGYQLKEKELQRLRVPVIVALNVAQRRHFSVLRDFSTTRGAALADPSWGNRLVSRYEFRRMITGDDAVATARVLIVVPDSNTSRLSPPTRSSTDPGPRVSTAVVGGEGSNRAPPPPIARIRPAALRRADPRP